MSRRSYTLGAATLLCVAAATHSAHALNPAVCEQDVTVRPQWLSFEGGPGVRFGAPDDVARLTLAAEVAYTLGLTTLGPHLVDGSCQYDLDSAVDFLRAGAGYQRAVTDFETLDLGQQWVLGDLSWYRILPADLRVSVGVAVDYGLLDADTSATSLGGVLRVNYADWVTLATRLGTVVSAQGQPEGGVNATIGLAIEPRLWCEHVTRKRCEPSWFISSLLQ